MSLPDGCRTVTFRFKDTAGRTSSRDGGLDECVKAVHFPTEDDPHMTHDGLFWFDPPETPAQKKRRRRRRGRWGDDVYGY